MPQKCWSILIRENHTVASLLTAQGSVSPLNAALLKRFADCGGYYSLFTEKAKVSCCDGLLTQARNYLWRLASTFRPWCRKWTAEIKGRQTKGWSCNLVLQWSSNCHCSVNRTTVKTSRVKIVTAFALKTLCLETNILVQLFSKPPPLNTSSTQRAPNFPLNANFPELKTLLTLT